MVLVVDDYREGKFMGDREFLNLSDLVINKVVKRSRTYGEGVF